MDDKQRNSAADEPSTKLLHLLFDLHPSGISPVLQNQTYAQSCALHEFYQNQRSPQTHILLKVRPENGFHNPVMQLQPALLLGLTDEVVDVKGFDDEPAVTEVNLIGCSETIHVQNIGVYRLLPKLIYVIYHLVQNPPVWKARVQMLRTPSNVKLETIRQILFLCSL